MNLKRITVLLISMIFVLSSCSIDDDLTTTTPPIQIPNGDYENGILVSHEGSFMGGNASVSFVTYDFQTNESNIFNTVNNNLLGDTAQSIAFNNDLAYIVVNGSNKIEVVNRYTFESVATMDTGLSNPRYIAFSNGKGYVTNWGDASDATDDYVAVIDLSTNTLSGTTISVEEGPEKIITTGSKLYVALQGGWGQNNKVSVIDTSSDTVNTTIIVGDVPNSLQVDASGNLWVLCGGVPAWTGNETAGQLFKIDTVDNSTTVIDFSASEHPSLLLIENDNLYYYMGGSIYKMSTIETILPSSAEITGLSFYGMSINNGILYGVDAGDFTSNGTLQSYDLSTNTLINTIEVNVVPGSIHFN